MNKLRKTLSLIFTCVFILSVFSFCVLVSAEDTTQDEVVTQATEYAEPEPQPTVAPETEAENTKSYTVSKTKSMNDDYDDDDDDDSDNDYQYTKNYDNDRNDDNDYTRSEDNDNSSSDLEIITNLEKTAAPREEVTIIEETTVAQNATKNVSDLGSSALRLVWIPITLMVLSIGGLLYVNINYFKKKKSDKK